MRPGSGDARQPAPAPWAYALYHFGTSGAAVAAATAVTHPLGQISALRLISSNLLLDCLGISMKGENKQHFFFLESCVSLY